MGKKRQGPGIGLLILELKPFCRMLQVPTSLVVTNPCPRSVCYPRMEVCQGRIWHSKYFLHVSMVRRRCLPCRVVPSCPFAKRHSPSLQSSPPRHHNVRQIQRNHATV